MEGDEEFAEGLIAASVEYVAFQHRRSESLVWAILRVPVNALPPEISNTPNSVRVSFVFSPQLRTRQVLPATLNVIRQPPLSSGHSELHQLGGRYPRRLSVPGNLVPRLHFSSIFAELAKHRQKAGFPENMDAPEHGVPDPYPINFGRPYAILRAPDTRV
jgi:hypothetical protein